jgi:hypothetical protein
MNDAHASIASNASSAISMLDAGITPRADQNIIRNGYHQIKVEVVFKLYNGSDIPPDVVKQYSTLSFLDYDDGSDLSSSGWAWSEKTNGYAAEYNGELGSSFDPEKAAPSEHSARQKSDADLATFTFFLSTTDSQGRDLGFQVVFDAGSAGYGSGSQTFTCWANGDTQLQSPPHVTICDPRPYQVTTDVKSNAVDTYPTFNAETENFNQENTFFVLDRSSAYVKDVVFKMDSTSTSSGHTWNGEPPAPNTFYNPNWAAGSYIYNQDYEQQQESYDFYIWPIGPQGKAPLYPYPFSATATYNDEQAALCVTKIYAHDGGLQQPNAGWYYDCHLTIFDQWGNNFRATIQIDYDNAVAVKMVDGWVESGRPF